MLGELSSKSDEWVHDNIFNLYSKNSKYKHRNVNYPDIFNDVISLIITAKLLVLLNVFDDVP